jgi:uroporphyrinogen-III synthase
MRLIITRPRADAEVLGARLREMGHQVLLEPMLTIQNLPEGRLDLAGAAALLLTSANGARALAEHAERRDLPVLAVGEATAAAARRAGFREVTAAAGDVTGLAALVRQRLAPEDGALVHVAGSAVAGDLAGDLGADGYKLRRAVLYRADAARRFSPPCRAALASCEIDGVLFFSPRGAATFVKLLRRDDLLDMARGVVLYGLSPAVTQAGAGAPWKRRLTAPTPRQDELLALL